MTSIGYIVKQSHRQYVPSVEIAEEQETWIDTGNLLQVMERKVVQIDIPLAEQIQFQLNQEELGANLCEMIDEEAFWTAGNQT
jgi:hypothetical protein